MISYIHRVLHDIFILMPAFLAVFTMRGFSKALFARLSGDRTAASEGFISLNPLVHIDLLGLIFFVGFIGFTSFLPDIVRLSLLFTIFAIAGVRWTYEVPIDERQFFSYRGGVIATALAGPLGNFFLVLVCMYIFTYVPFTSMAPHLAKTLHQLVQNIVEFSLFFGVIDLVPLPPFEGGRLLPVLLPQSMHGHILWLQERAPFIFLILFLAPGVRTIFFSGLQMVSMQVYTLLSYLVF